MNTRSALLLGALLALPLGALAQAPAPDAPPPGMHGAPSADRMTERMSQDLGLDAAQTDRLRALNERHAADLNRLREEHEKGLREILTPEQWQKFEEHRKQRHQRRRDGMRKRGVDAPPPA